MPALKTGKTIPSDTTEEGIDVDETTMELCVGLRSRVRGRGAE